MTTETGNAHTIGKLEAPASRLCKHRAVKLPIYMHTKACKCSARLEEGTKEATRASFRFVDSNVLTNWYRYRIRVLYVKINGAGEQQTPARAARHGPERSMTEIRLCTV